MTEQTPSTTPGTPADPAAAAAAVTPPSAATPPEGFVSREELEREQARSRSFQAEYDRVKATLDSQSAPSATTKKADPGFDPDAFGARILDQVYGANAIATAAVSLRSEFPHADPSFFSPEKMRQYGSVDAFRISVEGDHRRVASLLSVETARIESEVKAKYAAAYGQEPPTGPSGSGTVVAGGDPDPATLVSMSMDELAQFEKDHPGVAERVLRSAL